MGVIGGTVVVGGWLVLVEVVWIGGKVVEMSTPVVVVVVDEDVVVSGAVVLVSGTVVVVFGCVVLVVDELDGSVVVVEVCGSVVVDVSGLVVDGVLPSSQHRIAWELSCPDGCVYPTPGTGSVHVAFSLSPDAALITSSVHVLPASGSGTMNGVSTGSIFRPLSPHQKAGSFVFGVCATVGATITAKIMAIAAIMYGSCFTSRSVIWFSLVV